MKSTLMVSFERKILVEEPSVEESSSDNNASSNRIFRDNEETSLRKIFKDDEEA